MQFTVYTDVEGQAFAISGQLKRLVPQVLRKDTGCLIPREFSGCKIEMLP